MTIDPDNLPPILCAHLIGRVDERLIQLLDSLHADEWDLPTVVPLWKVRDIAAHLLDTTLRKLSLVRDGSRLEINTPEPENIIDLVNRLNHDGVTVFRRLSPRVLIDLMKLACAQSAEFHAGLDPFAPAAFAVSWAGEHESANWFDTARELTERWHHQQQIRLATGRPGIMTPELYHPVLDCFIRGLPNLYKTVVEPPGTTVTVEISGECGGQWFLCRNPTEWQLRTRPAEAAAACVTIPQEIAWRVFTKGINSADVLARVRIQGNPALGERVLGLLAIVG
jgi:uncharacterized protein (TIGR03083 family)